MMFQTGLARFDMETKTFRMFPVPAALDDDAMQQSMVMPRILEVSTARSGPTTSRGSRSCGSILKTGQYELIDPFKFLGRGHLHAPYGMAADAQNNLYFMDFGDENIGRVDAKTGAATIYPTPTPKSRPRRTMLDDQGRLWFTEFAANKLAHVRHQDGRRSRNGTCRRRTPIPTMCFIDKNGELWSGGMASDRVLRFDPQSGALGRISAAAADQYPPRLRR